MTAWIVIGVLGAGCCVFYIITWLSDRKEYRRIQKNAAWLHNRILKDIGVKEARDYANSMAKHGIDVN